MARIPFDIKFRPQIESGDYKVVTGDNRPVKIISWDKKAYGARTDIVALVPTSQGDGETVQLYYSDGKLIASNWNDKFKLFIITPEPEMTEFEAGVMVALLEFVKEVDANDVKRISKELLELSREQFQPEIDAEFEKAYKTADEVQYRKGREEALKDLPRWIPNRFDKHNFETCKAYLDTPRYLCYQDKMIDVSELVEKLPGFKEDCNE